MNTSQCILIVLNNRNPSPSRRYKLITTNQPLSGPECYGIILSTIYKSVDYI